MYTEVEDQLVIVVGRPLAARGESFQSRVCDKVPDGSTLIFGHILISLKDSVV